MCIDEDESVSSDGHTTEDDSLGSDRKTPSPENLDGAAEYKKLPPHDACSQDGEIKHQVRSLLS